MTIAHDNNRRWRRVGVAGLLALVIAGIAAVVVAIVVVAIVDYSYEVEATRQQLETMTARLDAIAAEARPWVFATLEIAGDLTFDDDGAHLPLRYNLINSGQVPAFNIIAFPILTARSTAATANLTTEIKGRCGDVVAPVARASRSDTFMAWDFAIFPGRQFTEDERADTDLPLRGANGGAAPQVAGSTLLISCVDYHAGHASDHHQTGDAFYLRRIGPGASQAVTDIDLYRRERIPAVELRLVPATRGTYAN